MSDQDDETAGARGVVNSIADELGRLRAENTRLRDEYRAFVDGLTEALNAHGVPAMPSWREAIDYLAAHGGTP